MPIKFALVFSITPEITRALLRIEAVKQALVDLPINPAVLQVLRETARLTTTHYSTQIEGNRLTQEEVVRVVREREHVPGRERDEREVKGYYAALDELEKLAARYEPITERIIQTLHARVMSDGRTKVKPTAYRDGQNVIRDSRTRQIVYMPPEAKDVFLEYELVTAKQIGAVFGFKPRTCSELCRKWVQAGFLVVTDPSRKARKYALAQEYRILLD